MTPAGSTGRTPVITPSDPDAVGLPAQAPARTPAARRPRGWSTPARIRSLAFVAMVLAVVSGLVAMVGTAELRHGFREIGHRAGPQAVATSDLYFVLNDMDAQVANVLLAGGEPGLGVERARALQIYEQRRSQASRNLQQAAAAAGNAPETAPALRRLLDGFGRYQALVAETILLDGRRPHAAGRPPDDALARYRQATELMSGSVLVEAERLTRANSRRLDQAYDHESTLLASMTGVSMILGLLLLGVLATLQVLLAQRLRRTFNPALALATLAALVFTSLSIGLCSEEKHHLTVAKKDAFDSVIALSRARAIGYAARADESRYIVDPARRVQYEQGFLDRSQQLAALGGATIGSYDALFAEAWRRYESTGVIAFGGVLGAAMNNITFPGERERAEDTMRKLRAYQADDRKMRAKVQAGSLREAIRFTAGDQPGDSNHAFDQYDRALESFLALNQRHFDRSVTDAEEALSGWTVLPPAAMAVLIALVYTGVRPRLAEYR